MTISTELCRYALLIWCLDCRGVSRAESVCIFKSDVREVNFVVEVKSVSLLCIILFTGAQAVQSLIPQKLLFCILLE